MICEQGGPDCTGEVRVFAGTVAFCEGHWPEGWISEVVPWCGRTSCAVQMQADPLGAACTHPPRAPGGAERRP